MKIDNIFTYAYFHSYIIGFYIDDYLLSFSFTISYLSLFLFIFLKRKRKEKEGHFFN